jgi:Inner membrane component of T3SS, cytoplasmic domain
VALVIQLDIISGQQAGRSLAARHFPFAVGREPANQLQLQDEGVWNEHFQLTLDPASGFNVTAHPGALLMVNQTPTESVTLRNGDLITVGAAKLAFRISPTKQRGLQFREFTVWSILALVTLSQLALILWLLVY